MRFSEVKDLQKKTFIGPFESMLFGSWRQECGKGNGYGIEDLLQES